MGMCVFDVQGNISMATPYVSVYRKGQMLVIEFVNNLILPLRVIKVPNGGIDLYFVDELAFTVDDERSAITVSIDDFNSYSDLRFNLLVGTKEFTCSATAGHFISIGELAYLEVDVLRWCKKYDICLPVGCVYLSRGMYIERGCDVDTSNDRVIISLPEQFKFPVERTQSGVLIAGIYVPRKYPDSWGVFVKVYSRRVDTIHFRVVMWEPKVLTVLDNLVYSKAGIQYGDRLISCMELTKRIVLGGSYEPVQV